MKVLFVPPLGEEPEYVEITEKIGEPTTCTITLKNGTIKTHTGVTIKHLKMKQAIVVNLHGEHEHPDSLGEGKHVLQGSPWKSVGYLMPDAETFGGVLYFDAETPGLKGKSIHGQVEDEIADFKPEPATSWSDPSSDPLGDLIKYVEKAKQQPVYQPPEYIIPPSQVELFKQAMGKAVPGMQQVGKASEEAAQAAKKIAESQMAAHEPQQPPEGPQEPLTVSPDLFATAEEDEAWVAEQQAPKFATGGPVPGGSALPHYPAHVVEFKGAVGGHIHASVGTHSGVDKSSVTLSAKGLTITKLDAEGQPIPGSTSKISPKFSEIVAEGSAHVNAIADYSAADVKVSQMLHGLSKQTISAEFTVEDPHAIHILSGDKPLTCTKCHPAEPSAFEKAVEEHAPDYEVKANPWGISKVFDVETHVMQKHLMMGILYGGGPDKIKSLYEQQFPPAEQPEHDLHINHGDGTYSTPNPPLLFGAYGSEIEVPPGHAQPGTWGSQSQWWRFTYRMSSPHMEMQKHGSASKWASTLPAYKTIEAINKEMQQEHENEIGIASDLKYYSGPPSLVCSLHLFKEVDPWTYAFRVDLPEASLTKIGKHLGAIP